MNTTDPPGRPRFGVVINTFNRADVVPRAIHSVLEQSMPDLELVVVDDGSTDETAEVLAAIDDPRLRCVRQSNQGFGAARNHGTALTTAEWVTFLDDDDEAIPEWLATLDALRNEHTALVSCGALYLERSGEVLEALRPTAMGPVFDDVVVLFLSGTFALRRDVYLAVGGYAELVECSQNTELLLRLVPYCTAHELEIVSTETPGVRIERRASTDRPSITPERLIGGGEYVLEHHGERLARSGEFHANWQSVMGVSAARLGDFTRARRYLAGALRADPLSFRRWTRLGLALVPPVGSRVWRRDAYSDRKRAISAE